MGEPKFDDILCTREYVLVFGLLGKPKFDDILCTREYVLVMKMERKGLVYTVYETVIYL